MEPKVIETLVKKLHETSREVQILYDLNEAEVVLVIQIVMQVPTSHLTPDVASKLLRAAAHYLEASYEIAQDIIKEK